MQVFSTRRTAERFRIILEGATGITTFDTLKFAQRLEEAGLERKQAIAFAEAQKDAFAEAIETQLATKADTQRLERELLLLKWMIGFNLAFTMAIVWRIFS